LAIAIADRICWASPGLTMDMSRSRNPASPYPNVGQIDQVDPRGKLTQELVINLGEVIKDLHVNDRLGGRIRLVRRFIARHRNRLLNP
jgi:hypothetical protein